MIDLLPWDLAFGVCYVVLLGVRRIPWPHALVSAAGMCLVLALVPGWAGLPVGSAVFLAAIGGGVASLAFERGERARTQRVAEILEGRGGRRT